MKKKLLALAEIFVVLLSAQLAYAQPNPPSTVWRIDTRPPSEIFQNGFRSWGTNNNPVAHSTGASCIPDQNPDSAFISTTASEDFARAYVNGRADTTPDGVQFTIYEIRATDNFYSLPRTLADLDERGVFNIPASARIGPTLTYEWDAIETIPPSLIRSAITYTVVNRRAQAGDIQINNNYIEGDTHANNDPYQNWPGGRFNAFRNWFDTRVRRFFTPICFSSERNDLKRSAESENTNYRGEISSILMLI
ncbi:TPA: scabin-related ADP-ribosyltransferase [Pseudomonas aeruginosa]|uniref:scabin-related ADP-ribosyltransferase n=1 Tax=Pseudomonas aeruginosa TaxID=287 RepID=UPI0032E3FC99